MNEGALTFADELRAIYDAEVERKKEQKRLEEEAFIKSYVLPESISEKLKEAAINKRECILTFNSHDNLFDKSMTMFEKWARIQGLTISYKSRPNIITNSDYIYIKVSW